MAQQAMRQIQQMQGQMNGLGGQFGRANNSAQGFRNTLSATSQHVTRFGSQMQWTGRQVEYNFTLPIVAAGAAAMKFALENEAAMVRVEKVYGDGTQTLEEMRHETDALGRAFEQLSNNFGVNRAQVIAIGADWAAAGSSGLALAKAVEQTLKTMILGEMGSTEATRALIAIQAQYTLSTKELTETIDMLNMVENQTAIKLSELVEGFSRAAGTARSAGVSTRELAAMMAALVPAAGTAAQAGNALKTIFSRMLAPTEEAKDVLGLMGINTADMGWQSLSAADRLMTLAKAFTSLGGAEEDHLTGQAAVVSSLVASRYQINKFEVLMQDMVRTQGRYQTALRVTEDEQKVFDQSVRELNAVLDSNPRKLEMIKVLMQNALADAIQPMIPAILSLASSAAAFFQKLSELNPSVLKLITVLLLLIAVVGPLLRYLGATFVLLGSLGRAFAFASTPVLMLASALWVLIKIPVLAFLSVVSKGVMMFGFIVSRVFLGIGLAFKLMWLGLKLLAALTWVGVASMMGAWRFFVFNMMGLPAVLFARVSAIFVAGFQTLRGITILGWANIRAIFLAMTAAVGIIPTAVASLFLVLASQFWAGFLGLATIAQRATVMLSGVLYRGWAALFIVANGMFFTLRNIFVAGWASVQAATATAWVGLRALFVAGRAALLGIWLTMQTVMLVQWRAMWAAMVLIGANFMSRMRGIYVAFLMMTRTFSTSVMAALTGPWGAAIALVILLVVMFWDELKQAWKAIVEGTIKAFNALPQGVQNAMLNVVRVVRAAVMAVYNLFSWMNPWAHHSPSLVENVTSGVAEIKNQFGSLGDIGSVFQQAGLDLEEFGMHVRKLQAAADAKAWEDLRKQLQSIAPAAIPSFDKLVSILGPLKDLLEDINVDLRAQQMIVDSLKPGLDAANSAYDEQKNILDGLAKAADAYQNQLDAAKQKLEDFASAPIEGMKAMGDAIFANTMEQKRLQLQLMQMEDAVGPLDQLQGRLDAINGQMELLSGEQTNLRNAGAGSEILSQYDDQIAALEDQQRAINEQVKPLQDLSDAIDDLGRKGQMLDLENSLKFDPLKKQIDDVAHSMKELPFEEILAGITEQRAAVDDLTQKYNEAQDAVDAQKEVVDQLDAARQALQLTYDLEKAKLDELTDKYQQVEDRIRSIEQAFRDLGQAARDASDAYVSPGVQNFLDAAGGSFPDPGGKGGMGREQTDIADQSKLIDDFTKELADKTKNMFGMFDFLEPIKRGWNKAWGWVKENIGPTFGEIGGIFGEKMAGLNPFKGASKWVEAGKEILGDIGGFFSDIWKLIGPDVMKIFSETWKALQDGFKTIQPEIAKFKDLIGPAGESIKTIWSALGPILGVILGLLVAVVKVLLSGLAGLVGPLIKGIADVIAGIIRVIRGLIEVIVGIFTGDKDKIWSGVKDIFLGLWDIIVAALEGLASSLLGLFWGLVNGIVEAAIWLWDELVGHSIIPDIVNGISEWWDKLVAWTKAPFLLIKDIIMAVVDWAKGKFDEWIEKTKWVRDKISEYIGAVTDRFWDIVTNIKGVWDNFWSWIDRIVDRLNGMKDRFSFGGIFDGLKNAFRDAMNWIVGKWNNLSFGVGDFKIGTPDIDFFASGGVTNGVAVVGEGRSQYPEYVIPTDPNYRKRAVQLFADLGKQLGVGSSREGALLASIVAGQKHGAFGQKVQMLASGGITGRNWKFRGVGGSAVVFAPVTKHSEYHFHGDLSFPNIKNGEDAETFVRNLEALLNEG